MERVLPLSLVGVDEQPSLQNKMNFLLRYLGADPSQVKKAFYINKPHFMKMFEFARRNITLKHQQNPGLFKKSDWSMTPDADQRKLFVQDLAKAIKNFRYEWNDGHQVNFFLFFSFLVFFFSPSFLF